MRTYATLKGATYMGKTEGFGTMTCAECGAPWSAFVTHRLQHGWTAVVCANAPVVSADYSGHRRHGLRGIRLGTGDHGYWLTHDSVGRGRP